MKIKLVKLFSLLAVLLVFSGFQIKIYEKTSDNKKISFIEDKSENKVDVKIGKELFTSYRWHDPIFLNIKKPVFYPVMTSEGTEVTRGFPLNPRPGERIDHPHHIGVCFNYGNVNGYDFWNNSSAIAGSKMGHYGTINHESIDEMTGGKGKGLLVTRESWVDPNGKELLSEKTEYHFISKGQARIIDRITTLTAQDEDVNMKDTKEGLYGIRVARQLELPSDEQLVLTDEHGNPTTVKKMSNEGVSGNYRSSKGLTGEDVFGTRGKWVKLYGNIEGEKISIVMIDHPDNPGYPAYWHARGYGLLLVNPLGAAAYSGGEHEMNYRIPAGSSATFRYRMIIHSGTDLTDDDINSYSEDFAGKYK
jgi:hypothetical protein